MLSDPSEVLSPCLFDSMVSSQVGSSQPQAFCCLFFVCSSLCGVNNIQYVISTGWNVSVYIKFRRHSLWVCMIQITYQEVKSCLSLFLFDLGGL